MPKRPNRPSVKDKGVDILFPDSHDADEDKDDVQDEPMSTSGERAADASDDAHASTQERKPAQKHARKHASMQAREELSDLDLIVFEEVLERVAGTGRVTSSFRFTGSELEALDDFIYRSRKRHNVRIAKQDVVRVGLAALLAEYKERGVDSIIGRYLAYIKER